MANTPNIDLVKPAGTDHALVSVLNSNSDKIDTFAGTTNQAIAKLSTKTYTDVANDSALKTYISNETSGLNLGESKLISFKCNYTTNVNLTDGTIYTGYIQRQSQTGYSAIVSSSRNEVVSLAYIGGTTNTLTVKKLDVVDNKTATITAHTGVTGLTIQLSMRQSGKVVSINGYVNGVSVSANTGVELLDFSGVDAPATNQDVRFTGTIADAAWLPGTQVYIIITSTNKIQITSPSTVSNKVLYFNATYIVA